MKVSARKLLKEIDSFSFCHSRKLSMTGLMDGAGEHVADGLLGRDARTDALHHGLACATFRRVRVQFRAPRQLPFQSFQVDRLGIAFVHGEPSSVSPPVCSQMRIIINSEHMSSPGNPPAASLRPPLGKGVKSAPKSGLERGEERAKGGENSCSPSPPAGGGMKRTWSAVWSGRGDPVW